MTACYDEIIRKCQSALRIKFAATRYCQAQSCLDAERQLIEERGHSDLLVMVAKFAAEQQQHGLACHLIGSGCASMINYLLDLSEVDPIEHRTLFQRFWITSDGSPPTFQFVVAVTDEEMAGEFSVPEYVSVHSMTPLEQIPAIIERRFPEISVSMNDLETFEAITAGDTQGVFQFETEATRKLATRIQPKRIDDLAIISALAVIECSEPNFVADYMTRSAGTPEDEDSCDGDLPTKARLFQESILSILHEQTRLSWNDSWRFILESAKGKLNEKSPLRDFSIANASNRFGDKDRAAQWIGQLVNASRTAACRAHHIANAITSYRAAFIRTHFREPFEQTLESVNSGR